MYLSPFLQKYGRSNCSSSSRRGRRKKEEDGGKKGKEKDGHMLVGSGMK